LNTTDLVHFCVSKDIANVYSALSVRAVLDSKAWLLGSDEKCPDLHNCVFGTELYIPDIGNTSPNWKACQTHPPFLNMFAFLSSLYVSNSAWASELRSRENFFLFSVDNVGFRTIAERSPYLISVWFVCFLPQVVVIRTVVDIRTAIQFSVHRMYGEVTETKETVIWYNVLLSSLSLCAVVIISFHVSFDFSCTSDEIWLVILSGASLASFFFLPHPHPQSHFFNNRPCSLYYSSLLGDSWRGCATLSFDVLTLICRLEMASQWEENWRWFCVLVLTLGLRYFMS